VLLIFSAVQAAANYLGFGGGGGGGGGNDPTTPNPRWTNPTPASKVDTKKRKRPNEEDSDDSDGIDWSDGLPSDNYLFSFRYQTDLKCGLVDRRNNPARQETSGANCLYPYGSHSEQNRLLAIHPDTRFVRSTDCTEARARQYNANFAYHERQVQHYVHLLNEFHQNHWFSFNAKTRRYEDRPGATDDRAFRERRTYYRELIHFHQQMWRFYFVEHRAVEAGILYRLNNPQAFDFVIYVLNRDNIQALVIQRTNSNLDIFDGPPTLPSHITTPRPRPGAQATTTTTAAPTTVKPQTSTRYPGQPVIVKTWKLPTPFPPDFDGPGKPNVPSHDRRPAQRQRQKRQDVETNLLQEGDNVGLSWEEMQNYITMLEPILSNYLISLPDPLTFKMTLHSLPDLFEKLTEMEKEELFVNNPNVLAIIGFEEPPLSVDQIANVQLKTQVADQIQSLVQQFNFVNQLLIGYFPSWYVEISHFNNPMMMFIENLRKKEMNKEAWKLVLIRQAEEMFERYFDKKITWYHDVRRVLNEMTAIVLNLNAQFPKKG
jgi:hypothetical protein